MFGVFTCELSLRLIVSERWSSVSTKTTFGLFSAAHSNWTRHTRMAVANVMIRCIERSLAPEVSTPQVLQQRAGRSPLAHKLLPKDAYVVLSISEMAP